MFSFYYGLNRSFQLTDEPIPPPRQRLDKARSLGQVAQHFANLVNGCIQVVVNINKRVRPETLLQFLPGHHLTRALQQDAQDLKGLASKFQLHPTFA
jgi:hypothetical protein